MDSPVKKVLVTIAGSELSIVTAKYAVCIAKSLGSRLIVQYVVNMKALEDLLRAKVFVKTESIEYEKELENQGNKYLANVKKLADAKQVEIETVLSKGIVHEEVVSLAKELDVDMLVMGELKDFVSRKDSFYNEGERMFREAKCPVLVAKDPEKIERIYDGL